MSHSDPSTSRLAEEWLPVLLDVVDDIRAKLDASRGGGEDWAKPTAQEGGDTIYAIDRDVEAILLRHLEAAAGRLGSIQLIAEGLGESGGRLLGHESVVRGYLIIDPIDGTRNLMYDKRSAWFLAALAPAEAASGHPTLRQACLALMAELPTSKAGACDTFVATVGSGVRAWRQSAHREGRQPLAVAPSRAETLAHGWAQVSNFFPGTKVLAATLMERIVETVLGRVQSGEALVFDDQYLTTGGQMVELICGRDRFCCDLRPLFYEILEGTGQGRVVRGLECHPYDVGGLLVAEQAGVVITDGWGRVLDCPMDVHSPVHWCGYANEQLRAGIEPVIRAFLVEHGLTPPD